MKARGSALRVGLSVLLGCLLMSGGAAAAWRWTRGRAEAPAIAAAPARATPTFPGGRDSPSNIMPDAYVGPDACARCHRENHDGWLQHSHRKMNQLADETTVVGDFAGKVIEVSGGVAHFEHAPSGPFLLTLERPGTARRVYRVTRTIGSRFKQFYAGVLIEGAPLATNTVDDEVVLPFGFWIEPRRWLPISYFDPYGDDVRRDGQPSFDPFKPKDIAIAKVCGYCHNTMPYVYRFSTQRAALGFLEHDMTLDAPTLRTEVERLVELPPQPDFPPLFASRLPLKEALVSVGISCESCHFGTRAHAEDDDEYRFGPTSPHFALRPADPQQSAERSKDNPFITKGICRQCHSSEGSDYPDGSSMSGSRESLELDQSACASEIACTNCHDPHVAGPREEAGADNPKHLAACTGCHERYEDRKLARTHARHAPDQASCLDCHMPRIATGITRAVRSHRISVPADPRMLAAGAPNACNLCHAQKSTAWTIAELERGWDHRTALPPVTGEGGAIDLEQPALDLWRGSPEQATKVVLIDTLSRRKDADALSRLLDVLEDPAGMTRAYAAVALERRLGRTLGTHELDVTASPERRAAQLAELRRTNLSGR